MNNHSQKYKNPLRRDGTSQQQRMLPALNPDYVHVDEKEISDWLLYARRYAGMIRYYNLQNQPEGDWQAFIEKDISTLVAMVSATKPDVFRQRFELARTAAESAVGNPETCATAFADMLTVLFDTAETLSNWYRNAVPQLSLHQQLDRLIQGHIPLGFAETIHWLRQGMELGLPLAGSGKPEIRPDRLVRIWPNGGLPPEEKPFLWGIPETKRQIYRETTKLEGLFRGFLEVMNAITLKAPQFLEETFQAYPQHQPHMALFLAFLQLMKLARNDMNSLTRRHLDFYYKDVLQLKLRPEDPDEVHLILALANNFDQHRISENTAFDGGADDVGADRIYRALEEIVVNRAMIDPEMGLRTLFLRKNFSEGAENLTEPGNPVSDFSIDNIFAAPVANSSDGLGGALPEEFPAWELMGNDTMPFAETGFAIASPMFLLGEGNRTIRLVFQFRNMSKTVSTYGRSRIKSELGNNVFIYLTGEKEWVSISNPLVDILTDIPLPADVSGSGETLGEMIFQWTLGPESPAIVPYSEDVHQRGLNTRFPVALFVFDNKGLSTLADLDLNLRGGAAVYASDAEYLKGEFVSLDNTIFRANADIIGIPPGDEGMYLWSRINVENPDPWIARNPDMDAPYLPGDVVSFNNLKYRANAKVWDLNPTVALSVWESGPLGNIGYDPAKAYQAKEFVSFDNWLFQAKVGIPAIAPSLSPSWKLPPAYGIDKTTYSQGEIARVLANYFVLRADEASNIEPGSADDVEIWQLIKVYENTPVRLYRKDEVVLTSDGAYFRALAGSKGLSPDSNANGWSEIAGFSSTKPYQPNEIAVFKERLYKTSAVIQGGSPEGSSGIWEKIIAFSGSNLYHVFDLAVIDGRLYEALFSSLGASPDQSGSSWTEGMGWDTATRYNNSDLVVFKSGLYAALFASKGVAPDGSTNSWNEVGLWSSGTGILYQAGDLVNFQGTLYRSGATHSEISPAGSNTGWREIAPYSSTVFYSIGDIVHSNGGLFKTQMFGFLATPSANNILQWQSLGSVASQPAFDSATLYNTGEIVQFDPGQGIRPYIATAKIRGIDPNFTGAIWVQLPPVALYNDLNEYLAGETVRVFTGFPVANRFFVATANVLGDHPLNSSFPWQNVTASVKEFDLQVSYSAGELVRVTESAVSQRFFRAASNCLGDHPTHKVDVWREITSLVSPWDSQEAYLAFAKVKIISPNETSFYQALQPSQGTDPSNTSNPWTDISDQVAGFQNTTEYQPENTVKVSGATPGSLRFFRANAYTLGVHPVNMPKVWMQVLAAPVNWTNGTTFQPLSLVTDGNTPYQTMVSTTGVRPSLGEKIWKKLDPADYSTFNVLPYDPRRSFISGDYCVFAGTIYQVANSGGIPPVEQSPDQNPLWEKKSTLAEYDARTEYPADAFVRFRGRIYRSQAVTRGIPPVSDLLVWESIDPANIAAYNQETIYVTGSYVVSGNQVFRANAVISETPPPEVEPASEAWQLILSYEAGHSYNSGDHVWVGGSIYKSTQPANRSKPGSGTTWEEIPEIGDYDPLITYEAGTAIYYSEKYYVSLFQSKGQTPGQNQLIWETLIRIADFNGIERFLPGEYVRYGSRIYRALTTVVGDDPENSPELWQAVGSFPPYKPGQTFFQYSHVISNGKIYMAMRNTTGLAPEDDTAGSIWRQVSYSYPYKFFRKPSVYKFDVNVSVTGIQQLVLENDEGVISPGKPFNPFGSYPKVGGNFYIGSHEVFSKAPSTVDLHLEWGNLPLTVGQLDFSTYYQNYGEPAGTSTTPVSPVDDNGYFTANVNLLLNGIWKKAGEVNSPISTPALPAELFVPDNNDEGEDKARILDQLRDFHSLTKKISVVFDRLNLKRDPNLAVFQAFRNGMNRGFLQLRLLKDFFHADFPRFVARAAIKGDASRIPNEPYTPLINRISLDYTASETINFYVKSAADFPARVEQFFHIHPFGHAEFFPVDETPTDAVFTSPLIVPVFDAQVINADGTLPETPEEKYLDATGNLFIGVRNLALPQNLHILFQVAEGSENPEHSGQRVVWSYLSYNRWKDFSPSAILSDATSNLLTPGIIKFALPNDMTDQNTLLPGGLFWIRGSIVNYADGIAKGIKVIPQAVLAGYEKQPDNDPAHLTKALPAETVTDLVQKQAAISEVSQPFPSFGGRAAESDASYYIRVSERLRHKNRGVSIWDYERLVLEQFPKIHKVKCINHGKPGNELAPGEVLLVVIPDLSGQIAANRLRPVVSVNLRNEIRNFLRARVSDFAEIQVISPEYEEVRIQAGVKFARGKDIGFYSRQIVKDITRYLAPWTQAPFSGPVFGSEVSVSGLLNFLDEQQYVDYIDDFRLEYRKTPEGIWEKVTGDSVSASHAAAILVPADAGLFDLYPIEEEKCQIKTSF
ncbi:MAG: baseplate J/gp47 family protein [Bacteroidia bacterium]